MILLAVPIQHVVVMSITSIVNVLYSTTDVLVAYL